MKNKKEIKEKSPLVRLLGISCSLLLLGSFVFIVISGFSYIAGAIVAASILGLAGPSVVSGEGILDILSSIVEMIVAGVQALCEMVINAITSIFG